MVILYTPIVKLPIVKTLPIKFVLSYTTLPVLASRTVIRTDVELRILKFTIAFVVLYVPLIIPVISTSLVAFATLNKAEALD